MELRTKRLRLRPPDMNDLVPMFEIMSDPSTMRYWSTLPHADLDVTRAWLEDKVARDREVGGQFMIELDGRMVGKVGASALPEFGFIIHPDFCGKGIATEASLAFIAHVFADPKVTHLHADVDPRNVPSLRLLHRLGFVETGRASNTFLLGDEWCDSVYLELQRPD